MKKNNIKKNTEHIRIKKGDKIIWKEYCKALGESSPKLFSKVIHSQELKLNERILNELKRKQEDINRKLRK